MGLLAAQTIQTFRTLQPSISGRHVQCLQSSELQSAQHGRYDRRFWHYHDCWSRSEHSVRVEVELLMRSVFICVICVTVFATAQANTVTTATLRDEVNTFLGKELAAHLSDIKSLDPPPDRILGVPTTGEYSWGTFMRS